GVRDQHVQASVLGCYFVYEDLHVGVLTGIANHIRALVDVGPDDRRAFASKQLDRGLADAGSRAGYDRDLACQTSAHAAAHSRGLWRRNSAVIAVPWISPWPRPKPSGATAFAPSWTRKSAHALATMTRSSAKAIAGKSCRSSRR